MSSIVGLVVHGQDEVADAAVDLRLDGLQLLPRHVVVGGMTNQLGLQLRIVRAKPQLDRTVGVHLLQAGEQLIHVGFAQPEGMEPAQHDHAQVSRRSQQPGENLLVQHSK